MSLIRFSISNLLVLTVVLCQDYNISKNETLSQEMDTETLKCGANNCANDKGICYLDKCFCYKDYESIKSSDIYCNYARKNHFVALLLEFFFPFGAGHLYTESYLISGLKLLYSVLLIFFFYLYYNSNVETNNIKKHILVFMIVFYLFCLSLYLIWNIIDWILFGFNIYKDGNYIAMK